jgi:glutathionylspermidine synthase
MSPRPDWQRRVASQGLHYHTPEGEPYWDETACYRFTRTQIDLIEQATYALDKMCLEAVQHVIDTGKFVQFSIPDSFIDFIVHSWDHDELTIYGRFDLSYDGQGPPQLMEYNADTPTALLEAAVIQWFWLKDVEPTSDQFNSIHERLIEAWGTVHNQSVNHVYFSSLRGNLEDYMTANYLRDTAVQAGMATEHIHVEEIGWNQERRCFTDTHENPLTTVFKLYPWEWMLKEKFGPQLRIATTRWFEPPWKVLLSNKMILTVLCQLFPESPYLLKTTLEPEGGTFIKKPAQGREGANITLVMDGQKILETEGPYGNGPFVYQEVKPLPNHAGNYPAIGSWFVNGYACGLGIREDTSPITQNTSRFVPHTFS